MKTHYPNTYLVWDLETTGLEKESCKILEIGCMHVVDGKPTDRKSWLLNHGIEIPEKITEITGITKEMVDKDGVDPVKAIKEFVDIILIYQSGAHVTHNGMKFDIDWLAYHVAKTLGWTVGQHKDFLEALRKSAIDTAVFVKAEKLGSHRWWNESFEDFANRVMNVFAKGVKYNLGLCCEERGLNVEGLAQHRSLGDVMMTHMVYQDLIK